MARASSPSSASANLGGSHSSISDIVLFVLVSNVF